MKSILTACLLLWLPVLSFADDAGRRERVEALLVLIDADATIDSIYQQTDQMLQRMARQMDVQPSERELLEACSAEVFGVLKTELNWAKLKAPMTDLYLKHYSDKEIRDIIAFYKSPTGRAMVKKMPVITQESMQISQNLVQEILPKLQGSLEALEKKITAARKARN